MAGSLLCESTAPSVPQTHRAAAPGLVRFLLIALLVALACIALPRTARAAAADIALAEADPAARVNTPFDVAGMLPGDAEHLRASVHVTHEGAVSVYFQVQDVQETKRLSRELEVTVTDRDTRQVIARSSVADLSGTAKVIELPASSTGSTSLDWDVSVGLPASAGNGYARARASFDLVWSVASDEGAGAVSSGGGASGALTGLLSQLPQTGELPWYLACVALAVAGALCLRQSGALRVESNRGGGLLLLTVA